MREKTDPFVFMNTYAFIDDPESIELINPDFPGLEGRILIDLKDMTGKAVVRNEIAAVMNAGSAWVDLYWYKPGIIHRHANKPSFGMCSQVPTPIYHWGRRLQGIRI